MWKVIEITEIDHLDTVVIQGCDPNETVSAYCVNALTGAAITVAVTNNIVQINQVGVDDYRVIVFAWGKVAP